MTSTLFVSHWGAGPDVVFLHGLGASSRYWENVAEASTGYRATAPDLLGFGRSPAPAGATYDVACHLDALEPTLPPRFAVVAHSAGAVLAAALAARHPTRVASLLLVGLPAYPDARSAHQSVGRLGLLARLTVENNPAARVLCQTMCRYQSLAIALAPFVIRDLPPAIASDAARHTWASYSRTLQRVVVDHRAVEDVVATPMPVTLLHGGNDQAAPVSFVEALSERAALRPQPVQLQLVDGDHHLAVRQPAVVAAALSAMRTGGST